MDIHTHIHMCVYVCIVTHCYIIIQFNTMEIIFSLIRDRLIFFMIFLFFLLQLKENISYINYSTFLNYSFYSDLQKQLCTWQEHASLLSSNPTSENQYLILTLKSFIFINKEHQLMFCNLTFTWRNRIHEHVFM